MNSLPVEERVNIAIGLGYEFWGPRWIDAIYNDCSKDGSICEEWKWVNWNTKKSQQKLALDKIFNDYVTLYPEIYFKYLGKPFVPVYINDGTDNPPIEKDGTKATMYFDGRYTIKNVVGWNATWAYTQTNNNYYHNGQDNKYNGWGWGSLYGGTTSTNADIPNVPLFTRNPPLPYSAECMSIMPGTFNYWNKSATDNVLRDNGEYYINSWKEVIINMPRITIIADWNNWDEETAIEGCTGPNGWNDLNGNPTYDWYLQITQIYSKLFKSRVLLPKTYYKIDGDTRLYYWDGLSTKTYNSTFKPDGKPIIQIPSTFSFRRLPDYEICKNTNDKLEMPFKFALEQNYPNPFNPASTIKYSVKDAGLVSLKVFNILGQQVAELVNETMEPGFYEVNFNAGDLASGVYIYRMQAGEFTDTKKMLLLK